jgi:hypothetical protein
MSLQNKFMNRMFRRISGVVIDALSGKVGIKTDDGVFTCELTGSGATLSHEISVNILDGLSFNVPGFASQVEFDKVKAGDLVVNDKGIGGWVVGKTAKALKLADHTGSVKTYQPPKVTIMGGAGPSGVLVVQTLFSLTGSAEGAAGIGQMLPMLMLLGDGNDSKLDSILPLILMQGATGGAAAGGLQSILPFLLMKDGGLGGGNSKLDKLLPLLAMGGLGGAGAAGGAMNPMLLMALMGDGDIFGGSSAAKVAPALQRNGAPQLRNVGSW